MRKVLLSIALVPFWVCFLLIMIFFHPILWAASKINNQTLDAIIRILNHVHIINLFLTTGSRVKKNIVSLPDQSKPIIIISNHQNMYDVALLITTFSKTTPHFIAKKQLAKWIPSVSLILRTRNGILIDRKAGRDAVQIIGDIGKQVETENLCVVIFPEGTRAKDGILKPFKQPGLKTLLTAAPHAQVVPVAFKNHWKFGNPKSTPLPFFVTAEMTVLPAIDRNQSILDQINFAEAQIALHAKS